MKLYEIASQYDTLVNFDLETDGDIAAFRALMDDVQGEFDEKAESICKLIRSFQADADAFKAEKQRLEKKQKALENKAAALKEYLAFNARAILHQGERRRVGLFTIGFRKSPPKLVIDAGAAVPEEFYKREIDTARLKDAIKNGEEISGVRLESTESLSIN